MNFPGFHIIMLAAIFLHQNCQSKLQVNHFYKSQSNQIDLFDLVFPGQVGKTMKIQVKYDFWTPYIDMGEGLYQQISDDNVKFEGYLNYTIPIQGDHIQGPLNLKFQITQNLRYILSLNFNGDRYDFQGLYSGTKKIILIAENQEYKGKIILLNKGGLEIEILIPAPVINRMKILISDNIN